MPSEGIEVFLEVSEFFPPVEGCCIDIRLLHVPSHHVHSPFLTCSCRDVIHYDMMSSMRSLLSLIGFQNGGLK